VVGAGDVARDVGRHLAKRGLGPLLFANRTPERARALAHECGGRPVGWDEIAVALRAASVVVAATAAPSPILPRAALDAVAAERGEAAPTIVDLGVPRNVEPGSRLAVVDIDDVRDRQGEAHRGRQAAVPAVREIVEREVASWLRWRRTRAIDDLVRTLYRDLDAHSSAAVGTLADRYGVDAAEAERVVRRSMRPLLHEHVRRLRAVAAWDSGTAGLAGELSSGGAGT
jgi:glutamyl-tRNA reductase